MRYALLTAIAIATTTVRAEPRVEVFTDHQHPVTHPESFQQVTLYHLDGLSMGQAQLSKGLPADPQAASTLAAERLDANPALNDQMMAAGQGLVLMHLQYRLDRYPAIVLDGTHVIFGVTDLAVAKRLAEARP